MADALETALVGVTFSLRLLEQLDAYLETVNATLLDDQVNRQDFIRKATAEKLERVVKEK